MVEENVVKVGDKPLEKYIEAIMVQLVKYKECTVVARGRHCDKLLRALAAVVGNIGKDSINIEYIKFDIVPNQKNASGKYTYVPVLEVKIRYIEKK